MGRGREKARPVYKDRFISKMFLRGDSVILVIKMGEEMWTEPKGYSANNIAVGSEHIWPEQDVAPHTDLGARPKVSSNSQIPRMSVKCREQEMPPELASTMIIEKTSQMPGARGT